MCGGLLRPRLFAHEGAMAQHARTVSTADPAAKHDAHAHTAEDASSLPTLLPSLQWLMNELLVLSKAKSTLLSHPLSELRKHALASTCLQHSCRTRRASSTQCQYWVARRHACVVGATVRCTTPSLFPPPHRCSAESHHRSSRPSSHVCPVPQPVVGASNPGTSTDWAGVAWISFTATSSGTEAGSKSPPADAAAATAIGAVSIALTTSAAMAIAPSTGIDAATPEVASGAVSATIGGVASITAIGAASVTAIGVTSVTVNGATSSTAIGAASVEVIGAISDTAIGAASDDAAAFESATTIIAALAAGEVRTRGFLSLAPFGLPPPGLRFTLSLEPFGLPPPLRLGTSGVDVATTRPSDVAATISAEAVTTG
mmetsp:Transcript_13106/g.37449  ORF Transcript_13106/g.37449 Transcript_13106/m.37449 type:complete len:372 (+) Transcript_13106:64-1179(+)